jgi:hypothetical protein
MGMTLKTKEQILNEIEDYKTKAMEAYKNRDFKLEDECDRQATILQEELECRFQVTPYLAVLIPHTWNVNTLQQFGDARCEVCGQKKSYYDEGISSLSQLSEAEKHTRRYNQTLLMFNCNKRGELK